MWFGALLVALGFVVLARIAIADDSTAPIAIDAEHKPTAEQLSFALDVARTAVNEASLSAGPRDVALVYEATRYHADNDSERLVWLRRHSRCANPSGDCNRDGRVDALDDRAAARRPGNAGWTRYLSWSDEQPHGFRAGWRWRAERWTHALRYALRIVMEDESTEVCGAGVPVRTWGRPSDFRDRPAHVAVDCGARNLGATTLRYRLVARRVERARGFTRAIALDEERRTR